MERERASERVIDDVSSMRRRTHGYEKHAEARRARESERASERGEEEAYLVLGLDVVDAETLACVDDGAHGHDDVRVDDVAVGVALLLRVALEEDDLHLLGDGRLARLARAYATPR